MAGGAQLISVYPEELSFQFELDKPITCDLKLVNNTKHHVAFKVKTTSPKKYFVRPNTGVIQPWDNAVITVTLQAQREYPPDMQCKDKFLLQSTKVPPNTDIDEMPPETFNKDGDKIIEECKLRVVYTSGHSDQGNSETDTLPTSSMLRGSKQDSDADLMHSSSYEEVHALQLARQQRESALQETKQLQHELAILKQHRKQKADAGFSLTFAAIIGLTGIVLGFLLNLALYSPHTV